MTHLLHQVGLIAINVIGDAAGGVSLAVAPEGSVPQGRKDISPMDDVTFDLNFDPATAAQIRELFVAKDRAVKAEDYDAAKRIKDAIERLKQVQMRGQSLGFAPSTADLCSLNEGS